jgi:hypothetical protein
MHKTYVLLWSVALGCSDQSSIDVDATPPAIDTPGIDAPPVDWEIKLDPASPAGALPRTLLGQYDLSGALFHYDQQAQLKSLMHDAGMTEWRVGIGRWEFGTLLLPSLTDGTQCPAVPPPLLAPAGTTDLDLIRARDWFTYTDGAPVTAAMIATDSRYKLDYVRSVIDVARSFGADAYVNIDHMPRALSANQTPVRTEAEWNGACGVSWTNKVSNVRPADPPTFAAATVGLVRRIVEGSGGEPGRPVRYWEFGNEPEFAYAWNPHVGDFGTYLVTAAYTLTALDTYRKQTMNANGQAIRIGLGSFGTAMAAAAVVQNVDAPFDFISFHSEHYDDPLLTVGDIETVANARDASTLHKNAELVLAEWTHRLMPHSDLDPHTMDVALHHATVLALGAALGLTRAHHAIFWDFYAQDVPDLGIINHDMTPKPAYYAFSLLAKVIGENGSRLAPIGAENGRFDAGMGAVLASKDGAGKVRVLIVNRNTSARTARIELPTGTATPAKVTTFDDPHAAPADVTPTPAIDVPARSIVMVEL